MKLYLDSGFLNQKEILKEAERNNCSFIIEIGARQVGKTFGTLQLMLNKGDKFILMRRTQTEADFLCNGTVNPFQPIDSKVYIKKETKYTGGIFNEEDRIGMTMALSTVAKIRGFYGGDYKYLVYDEFIPESHILKIKNEGDAFLNALITINGNRELEGRPPLITWLLANSNNIASPILHALNVTEKVESMINKGQEYSIMQDRGIMIIIPKSADVIAKRKEDSITRAIGGDSEFTEMAYDNKFIYNDNENVTIKPLSEYTILFSVRGQFTVYKHKSRSELYVTDYKNSNNIIEIGERTKKEALKKYPSLKAYFINGNTFFSSLTVKELYKNCIIY